MRDLDIVEIEALQGANKIVEIKIKSLVDHLRPALKWIFFEEIQGTPQAAPPAPDESFILEQSRKLWSELKVAIKEVGRQTAAAMLTVAHANYPQVALTTIEKGLPQDTSDEDANQLHTSSLPVATQLVQHVSVIEDPVWSSHNSR